MKIYEGEKKKMRVVAHRGDSRNCPENTFAAFRSAIEAGADSIEFDVHAAADGTLVVHHDYYLGRTNDGEGPVYARTIHELKALDAGGWFGSEYRGERIPTLKEVFEEFHESVGFEVELKGFGDYFINTLHALCNRFNIWDNVEFTAPPNYLIREFRTRAPKAQIGVFIPAPEPWMKQDLAERMALDTLGWSKFQVAHLPRALVTAPFVERLHSSGILAHAADCDAKEDVVRAYLSGVDQISTCNPRDAVQILRQADSFK